MSEDSGKRRRENAANVIARRHAGAASREADAQTRQAAALERIANVLEGNVEPASHGMCRACGTGLRADGLCPMCMSKIAAGL